MRVHLAADASAARLPFLAVFGSVPSQDACAHYDRSPVVIYRVGCFDQVSTIHYTSLYLKTLIPSVRDRDAADVPPWLTKGASAYAAAKARKAIGNEHTDWYRHNLIDGARQTALPLSDLSGGPRGEVADWSVVGLGFTAVEWLAQYADDPTVFEFFRLLPTAGSWESAFQTAFGLGIDDFYDAFEAHRAQTFPPLGPPETRPRLVILDDVETEIADAIEAEFEAVRRFFSDRFEAEASEFTIFVGRSVTAARAAVPVWHDIGGCRTVPIGGRVVLTFERCTDPLPH